MKGAPVFIVTVFALLLACSCTKTNPSVFSWDYLGRHYVADSASVSSTPDNRILAFSGYTIIGIDGGGQLAVGSYTLHYANNAGKPYLFYTVQTSTVYCRSGTLTITANNTSQISGYFTATLTDSTYISGSFTNLPYQ